MFNLLDSRVGSFEEVDFGDKLCMLMIDEL